MATVGASTAANIHNAELLANAATSANTASAIVRRDIAGNFSAGTITATLSGNATNITGTVAVANGGTGLTSGTSGGVPYYSASGTLASSAVLAANGVVLGGGAGAAPTTTSAGSAYQALSVPAGGGAPVFGAIDLSQAAAVTNTLRVANGGTGTTATPTSGQLLIGNGSGFTLTGLTSGTSGGVTVTNSAGSITLDTPQDIRTTASPTFATITATTAFKFPDGTTQTSAATAAVSPTCSTGYVMVPNDGKFSFKDFCVMKYAASQDATTKLATSVAANTPWASLTWYEAKDACQTVGAHLITDGEWMTIARNIEATAINNLDGSSPVHLATGHSDNSPASALAATTDPSLASCTITVALNDAANSSCALKAGSAGTGSYYGEGAGDYYTGTYSAGATGMAQMRTFVLSNSNILWDMAGNVWQWTDMQCGTTDFPASGTWWDWNSGSLTSQKPVAGPSGSETSTGGAGQYYGCASVGNAMLRGGDCSKGAGAGVFAANLINAPSSVYTTVGFRCAYAP